MDVRGTAAATSSASAILTVSWEEQGVPREVTGFDQSRSPIPTVHPGYAQGYVDFLELPPTWKALDKARFFLGEANDRDVSTLPARRAAVFNLDAALVMLASVRKLANRVYQSCDWWRDGGRARFDTITGGDRFRYLREARRSTIYSLDVRAPTVARFTRGGDVASSELYFRDPEFSAKRAIDIVDDQIDELATYLHEYDPLSVHRGHDAATNPPSSTPG